MLQLTILGSGTSVPSAQRAAPAHLVRAGDSAVLLDCGSGCTQGLARAGLGLERLSAIVLTHLHPDHTADLLPLLFALANPVGPRREGELPLYGPAGTGQRMEGLRGLYRRWVEPRGGAVRVQELEDGASFEIGPARFAAFAVQHMKHSLAYRVEHEGATLCFSGDTGPCAGLDAAARGVDLLLCECAALEGDTYHGHMTAADVGRAAATAGCGQVVLTHLYDHIVAADPVRAVAASFSGPVRLAEDGMTIDIHPRR